MKCYGSKFHLRRLVNEEPEEISQAVVRAYQDAGLEPLNSDLQWKSPLTTSNYYELGGMEFFNETDRRDVVEKWRDFWPTTGRSQKWDGWAMADEQGSKVPLLVEAKANVPELESQGSRASPSSLDKIIDSLNETKRFLGVDESVVWHKTYYQLANRLAALYFLNKIADVSSRLILIYFAGDVFPNKTKCPETCAAWKPYIQAAYQELGLPDDHPLKKYVLDVFVPVDGQRGCR